MGLPQLPSHTLEPMATHMLLATNTPLASHTPLATLATHGPTLDSRASLPTPTVPSSQLTSQLSTLPRPSTLPLTDSQSLQLPHTPTPLDILDSWPTPTVPLSQSSPLMLLPLALSTWLPMLKKREPTSLFDCPKATKITC